MDFKNKHAFIKQSLNKSVRLSTELCLTMTSLDSSRALTLKCLGHFG